MLTCLECLVLCCFEQQIQQRDKDNMIIDDEDKDDDDDDDVSDGDEKTEHIEKSDANDTVDERSAVYVDCSLHIDIVLWTIS